MFVAIALLIIAIALFVGVYRGYINNQTMNNLASVAGVAAFLAAIAVFVFPSASPPTPSNPTTPPALLPTTLALVSPTSASTTLALVPPTLLPTTLATEEVAHATMVASTSKIRVDPRAGELTITDIRAQNGIPEKRAGVGLQDSIITARFYNPTSTKGITWSYGFIFRQNPWDQDTDTGLYLGFGSNSEYYIWYTTGGPFNHIGSGNESVNNFNKSEGGYNDIALIVKGKDLDIFVNNKFIEKIEIYKYVETGDISVATGFLADDNVGSVIKYENFSVRSLDQ